ncbi:MAG: hypothetical protein SPE53_07220, partial [Prevotella sp.]|nr:hypothetical protein [Prevotella sp.]
WSITNDEAHNPQIMTSALINNLFNTEYVYALGADQSVHCSGLYEPKPMVASLGRPASFKAEDGTLTWSVVEGAKGYLIYKNGRYLALATECTYTDPTYTTGDVYTLRTMTSTGSMSLFAESGQTYADPDDTPQEGVEDDGIFPTDVPISESTANTDGAATNYATTEWEHYAAATYAGGNGTEDDPYLIETPEQLMKLAVEVGNKAFVEKNFGVGYSKGKYFKQTKDIVLSTNTMSGITWVSHTNGTVTSSDPENYTLSSENRTFSGIGYKNSDVDYQRFAGVYDGDGHTISGLINTAQGVSAIFNETEGAVIKNLVVKNSFVMGNSNASLLVGRAVNSTILNCATSGIMFGGGSYVAGIVGNLDNSQVLNCFTDAWIWGKNNIGGIAGKVLNNSLIYNSYFNGWCGPRYWAIVKFQYSGAISPELGYNTANEAKKCYWTDSCVVRYFTTPLEAINVKNSSGGVVTDCKAVSVSEVQNTVDMLNEEIVNIPYSYRWKVENGMPMLDFSSAPTGIVQIIADEKIKEATYNIQGQRVITPKKGIYIKNGKKIIYK